MRHLLPQNKVSASRIEFRAATGECEVIWDRARRPAWSAVWRGGDPGQAGGATFEELVAALRAQGLVLKFVGSAAPKPLLLVSLAEAGAPLAPPRPKAKSPGVALRLPVADVFTRRMEQALTADEGRAILGEHNAALHDIEVSLGLAPMVGEGGSGLAYCGFECLTARDHAQMVKRAQERDAAAAARLAVLIADGLALRPAWGKLLEREIQEQWDRYDPRPACAFGHPVRILVPGTERVYQARYALRELDDLHPSHNGLSFAPNPKFQVVLTCPTAVPGQMRVKAFYLVNDRDYTQPAQAGRVLRHAEAFEPAYLLADSPDALNGAPITDERGNVLGGNSRAMVLQRVYALLPAAAQRYRELLTAKAESLGFSLSRLAWMRQPVLCRELREPDDPQEALTDFNRPGTAPLTAAERAIVDARAVSAETLAYLSAEVAAEGDDATLAKVLGGPRGPKIVARLIGDRVISDEERAAYLDERGLVTPEGKTRIARLAVGRLFETAADFEAAGPGLRAKLERVVAAIARLDQIEGWGLLHVTKEALTAITEAEQRGLGSLDDLAAQAGLFGDAGYSPAALQIAKKLTEPQLRVVAAFRQFAADAEMSRGGLLGFVARPTPEDSFAAAFA